MIRESLMGKNRCKICGSSSLNIYAHTAKCVECGVLLYYPYPEDDNMLLANNKGKDWHREEVLDWYSTASFYNHVNFTNMLRFVMDESFKRKKLDILDYGGGGGQFALVCKSHFPESEVYITDISDVSLLDEWRAMNVQIPFKDFSENRQKFDVIFLNDVFEHISDPLFVLKQLSGKLKDGGKIFIDTPRQFWIYPAAKLFSKSLYAKVLNGTVTTRHLQIWSKKSFEFIVKECGLKITKYEEKSEYTMPANFYMKNMGIKNPLIRLCCRIFYKSSRWLANNKIICVLSN